MIAIVLSLPLTLAAQNGEALLPPMGWRSWNTFYADIDEGKIRAQVDALTKPRDAAGTTLLSLGYDTVGIDEGWEGCHPVHYPNGTPAVDNKRFPNMPDLVAYGHAHGVKMGFYLNGCGCNEKVEKRINYEGDVRATTKWGFDSVKIDSCGAQKNMTLYYELFNASGIPLVIENCHQGQNITDGGNPGQMGKDWCPYNLFRTSGDIVNLWDRVMSNLMTTVPFLSPDDKWGGGDVTRPVSRPGCWAYPDMLEVGRMPEHNAAESRSHMAAWAMISAPLTLGFDLSDDAKLNVAWPIIGNQEVLTISQTWIGGADYPSGRLLKSWQPYSVPTFAVRGGCGQSDCNDASPRCSEWAQAKQCVLNPSYMHTHCQKSCGTCAVGNFTGWRFTGSATSSGMLRSGDGARAVCLDLKGQLPAGHSGSNVVHALPCNASQPSQLWSFNGTSGAIHRSAMMSLEGDALAHAIGAGDVEVCLRAFSTWLWDRPVIDTQACSALAPRINEQWTLHANGTLQNGQFGCVEVTDRFGPPATIWAKPLAVAGQKMALLAINGADSPQEITLDFNELLDPAGPGGKTWKIRDVWHGTDLGTMAALTRQVPPHDCVLLVLVPE